MAADESFADSDGGTVEEDAEQSGNARTAGMELSVAINEDDGCEFVCLFCCLEDGEEGGDFAEGEVAGDVGEGDGGFADDVPEEFGGFEIDEGVGGDGGVIAVGDIDAADEGGVFGEGDDLSSGGPVVLELLQRSEQIECGGSVLRGG